VQICTVCCGTKRLVEIRCPNDCTYLKSSLSHPAATVQRQRAHDMARLGPTLVGLTERQTELFVALATFLTTYRPEGFQRLLDGDVAEAASALAGTFETALKGVIYEHRAPNPAAERLARDLRAFLNEITQERGSRWERDSAAALRRIEQGAREAGADPRAYLDLLGRIMRVEKAHGAGQMARAGSSTTLVP
jgi:hypothetical protein